MELRVHLIYPDGSTTFGAEEAIWIENDQYYIEVRDPKEAVIGVAELEREGKSEYYIFDPNRLPEWARQTHDIVRSRERVEALLKVITANGPLTLKEMARKISKLIDERFGSYMSSRRVKGIKYSVCIEYNVEPEDLGLKAGDVELYY